MILVAGTIFFSYVRKLKMRTKTRAYVKYTQNHFSSSFLFAFTMLRNKPSNSQKTRPTNGIHSIYVLADDCVNNWKGHKYFYAVASDGWLLLLCHRCVDCCMNARTESDESRVPSGPHTTLFRYLCNFVHLRRIELRAERCQINSMLRSSRRLFSISHSHNGQRTAAVLTWRKI